MTEQPADRTIVEDLLVYTVYDYIDLGHLRSVVREATGVDDAHAHSASMSVVSELIEHGLVAAGDVVDGEFKAWPCTRAEAVARIDSEWQAAADPVLVPFELAALAPTPAGVTVVELVMAREGVDTSWRARMSCMPVRAAHPSE